MQRWSVVHQCSTAQLAHRHPRPHLPRRVHHHKLQRGVTRLLDQLDHLRARVSGACVQPSLQKARPLHEIQAHTILRNATTGPQRHAPLCTAPSGHRHASPPAPRSRAVVHPTWSKRVANRLQEVRMPPLGPKLYCFITFLYLTCAKANRQESVRRVAYCSPMRPIPRSPYPKHKHARKPPCRLTLAGYASGIGLDVPVSHGAARTRPWSRVPNMSAPCALAYIYAPCRPLHSVLRCTGPANHASSPWPVPCPGCRCLRHTARAARQGPC